MNNIIPVAREWIGTPYHDGQSLKGVGCDCLGLARGVFAEVTGQPAETPPAYSRGWYEQGPETLLDGLARHGRRVPHLPLQDGALAVFRMRPNVAAKHCGFVAVDGVEPTLIHAYDRGHRTGVREEPLTDMWIRLMVCQFVIRA